MASQVLEPRKRQEATHASPQADSTRQSQGDVLQWCGRAREGLHRGRAIKVVLMQEGGSSILLFLNRSEAEDSKNLSRIIKLSSTIPIHCVR